MTAQPPQPLPAPPPEPEAVQRPVLQGLYGPFTISRRDELEVLGYRLSLLTAALALAGLLLQWQLLGGRWLWPWLLLRQVFKSR